MNAKPKTSFKAVTDTDTRLLILGSLPGEMSLKKQQYYANPSNRFWRLAGAIVGSDLGILAYEERLEVLLGAGIGLWDVIGRARRTGSADAAIRDAKVNSLSAMAGTLPRLEAIAFNGAKAAIIGRKQLAGHGGYALIDLPSSSAANCRMSFEQKKQLWVKLREVIG